MEGGPNLVRVRVRVRVRDRVRVRVRGLGLGLEGGPDHAALEDEGQRRGLSDQLSDEGLLELAQCVRAEAHLYGHILLGLETALPRLGLGVRSRPKP